MTSVEHIQDLIEPLLTEMGFQVVRLYKSGALKSETLHLEIDKINGESISIKDCTDVTYAIYPLLEAEHEGEGNGLNYNFEVSSPQRKKEKQKGAPYQEWIDQTVYVETTRLLKGQKKFKGRLLKVDEQELELEWQDQKLLVPFAALKTIRLMP